MNKNFLYFLPSSDEGGRKKTFFFFEHTHDGALKSSKLQNTDKAVRLIKTALAESTRNIVIDTSVNSGRNLLYRTLLLLEDDEQKKRIFLASLYRQHYKNIQKYWAEWEGFQTGQQESKGRELVNLFHSVRTLGGMRQITKWDETALIGWLVRAPDSDITRNRLAHPISLLLFAIAKESVGGGNLPRSNETRMIITQLTHRLFRLLQDPFPVEQEDENIYDTPYTRLFKKLPPPKEGQILPQNIIGYVCYEPRIETDDKDKPLPESVKQDAQRREHSKKIKKEYPVLWDLLTCCTLFLKSLGDGRMPLDACCILAGGHDIPNKIKNLLNAMLYIWMEVLVPPHVANGADTLHFVDHRIFSEHKSKIMLQRCKEIVQQCREKNV